jgi:regulator of replication initiation timing
MNIFWWKKKTPDITDVFNAVQQLTTEVMKMATQIAALQDKINTLVANVAAEGNEVAAATLAIKGLTDQQTILNQELKDAIAANDPAAIQAAADALDAQNQLIVQQTAALAAAIPANPTA